MEVGYSFLFLAGFFFGEADFLSTVVVIVVSFFIGDPRRSNQLSKVVIYTITSDALYTNAET